jgi:hypothetical protein
MTSDDPHDGLGSEIDLAISRALEAAKLQPGDPTTSTATVGQPEAFAVEVADDAGAADGD